MTAGVRTAAIVLAGGSGERFGRPEGKQLALVAGMPVVSWSLRVLDAAEEIDTVIVVCPADRQDEYREVAVAPVGMRTRTLFAPSGNTRQGSVASGLEQLAEDTEVVLVHDGARPLLDRALVSLLLRALEEVRGHADGVVVGHPSYDTLKVVDERRIVETADRSRYWVVQTPQVFYRRPFEAAHARAACDAFVGTDDAAIVEHAGGTVVVVEGPRENMMVTVPDDVAFVEAVLRRREGVR